MTKLPIVGGLAGVIAEESQENKQTQEPVQVNFTKKKTETTNENNQTNITLNEKEKEQLTFMKQLEDSFDSEKLQKIILLLNQFIDKPDKIDSALEIVRQEEERKEAA